MGGKRKVTLITGVYPPVEAPEGDYAFHLAENLARQYSVSVITSRSTDALRHPDFSVFPCIGSWGIWGLIKTLWIIRRESPEALLLLYLHFAFQNKISITLLPFLVRLFSSKTTVVTLLSINRGIRIAPERRMVNKLWWSTCYRMGKRLDFEYGSLLSHSHAIFHFSRRNFSKYLLEPTLKRKMRLVPPPPILQMAPVNPCRREQIRRGLNLHTEETVLLYFGYLYPGKGLEFLLSSLSLVLRANRRVKLLVLGGESIINRYPGENSFVDGLKKQSCDLGLDGHVLWLGGYQTDSLRTSEIIHSADIGVLPFEKGIAFNHSSASALLNHGLPLLSTRGPETESEFIHGENVYLIDTLKSEILAGAIQEVMDKPVLRKTLVQGGQFLCRQFFSWGNLLENLDQVLRTRGVLPHANLVSTYES